MCERTGSLWRIPYLCGGNAHEGEVKVSEDDVALLAQQDILRLQVAVDVSVQMQILQCQQNLKPSPTRVA